MGVCLFMCVISTLMVVPRRPMGKHRYTPPAPHFGLTTMTGGLYCSFELRPPNVSLTHARHCLP